MNYTGWGLPSRYAPRNDTLGWDCPRPATADRMTAEDGIALRYGGIAMTQKVFSGEDGWVTGSRVAGHACTDTGALQMLGALKCTLLTILDSCTIRPMP